MHNSLARGTPHLILASAAADVKSERKSNYTLEGDLTAAQIGSALRLLEAQALNIVPSLFYLFEKSKQDIAIEFAPHTYSYKQAFHAISSASELENTLGTWLNQSQDATAQAKAGYWLMSVFLRGLSFDETKILTEFLVDPQPLTVEILERSVRRYPTGGISEKQALILPAFLRYLSVDSKLCSSFLVARRLAHTGGTRDKLSALPGFSFPSAAELLTWDPDRKPVQYFSASSSFCARDAELYRLRGETGTVADQGLMAASIMSKQISCPAGFIILDILFGKTAFLSSKCEAAHFSQLCLDIAEDFGLRIFPFLRPSDFSHGACIGNVLELCEVISLLTPRNGDMTNEPPTEIQLALDFLNIFNNAVLLKEKNFTDDVLDAWKNGIILDRLYTLWEEHGVDPDVIKRLKLEGPKALLSNLVELPIKSKTTGILAEVDFIKLSDISNNILNGYRATNGLLSAAHGGIKIIKKMGSQVQVGETIALVYTENQVTDAVRDAVSSTFNIF